MFDPSAKPRVFALPPGCDFGVELIRGMETRLAGQPPEAWARVEIIVNTRRMQRRLTDLFTLGPPRLLPRIRLITDLAQGSTAAILTPPVSNLRRRLELSQLISGLLDHQPDLAPRAAIYDLADSLARLLAEMQDEGVSPAQVQALDVSDRSGHWQRSQMFLKLVDKFFGANSDEPPDQTARLRMVVESLADQWRANPPEHPIILAGSTGSRGTTAMLMQAIAALPQGAVVWPGFDFDLPAPVWDHMDDALSGEDHPQFRFRRLMQDMGLAPKDIAHWTGDHVAACTERNRLLSLALRPAPVTDQWMHEGPTFAGLAQATEHLSLIQAPSERAEALAIALVLREAADQGKRAALITPDRTLTRRVISALDRWGLEPDASIGTPLPDTAPGRLLLHLADVFTRPVTAEHLLICLKHPLTASGSDRGAHLGLTRALELSLRRDGPAFPTPAALNTWAEKQDTDQARAWAKWVNAILLAEVDHKPIALSEHITRQLAALTSLGAGPDAENSAELWAGNAGKEVQQVVASLQAEAEHGGQMSATDYANLLRAILSREEARDPIRPHEGIMIWGTLEARVQSADLVILGGLNDGTWPGLPSPDPWLNRQMRQEAGLLLPERQIGLSAHDFQQAAGAGKVILSRAVRDAEAETVPSRWLNRLTNLLAGMSAEGEAALKEMQKRGNHWLALAGRLETPDQNLPPEPRPAPRPPVTARPKSLSVTAITRLIRDPYAIYAQYVLGLRKLDPLHMRPDAPLRGSVLHDVMEALIDALPAGASIAEGRKVLERIAEQVLTEKAPWPATRQLWLARLLRVADSFLADEQIRRARGEPAKLESWGEMPIGETGVTLRAKADRIDRAVDGSLLIYDYKTGAVPSPKVLQHFDKQLMLEAIMAENGAFKGIDPAPVSAVGHIGLGTKAEFNVHDLTPAEIAKTYKELIALITAYQHPDKGFASRRAVDSTRSEGDFDHLARFGEWDETQPPEPGDVGQ